MTITTDQIKEALQLSYAMNRPASVELEMENGTLSFTLKNDVEWYETNPGDRENEPEGKWIGDFTLTEIELWQGDNKIPVDENEVEAAFRIAFESYYCLR